MIERDKDDPEVVVGSSVQRERRHVEATTENQTYFSGSAMPEIEASQSLSFEGGTAELISSRLTLKTLCAPVQARLIISQRLTESVLNPHGGGQRAD